MSKTEDNLKVAFSGESQARNKYTYFAKVAKSEGYNYIGKLFEETADNEMQHAKEEFKLLKGIGSTAENLKAAMDGEHYETKDMYPTFAREAEEEGNLAAANLFKKIGDVEAEHEARYAKLLKMVEDGTVFKRDKDVSWKCEKCGHIHFGKEAPETCPCCNHPQSYFAPECMCFSESCDKCC